MDKDYGEFEEIDESGQQVVTEGQEAPARVRLARPGEFIGVVLQRFGGNRMEIHCTDGKVRNCRVPGRFKRKFWLRPKDVVLIKVWEDDPEKGDIIFHYHSSAINQLRKKGILDSIRDEF